MTTMRYWARWTMVAALVYFVLVFPADAAWMSRVLAGSTELALGLADVVWSIRAFIAPIVYVAFISPPVLKRLVATIDVSSEDRIKLMVAYIGASGFVYSVVAAVFLIETAPNP